LVDLPLRRLQSKGYPSCSQNPCPLSVASVSQQTTLLRPRITFRLPEASQSTGQ
jgi:hypothetical protein